MLQFAAVLFGVFCRAAGRFFKTCLQKLIISLLKSRAFVRWWYPTDLLQMKTWGWGNIAFLGPFQKILQLWIFYPPQKKQENLQRDSNYINGDSFPTFHKLCTTLPPPKKKWGGESTIYSPWSHFLTEKNTPPFSLLQIRSENGRWNQRFHLLALILHLFGRCPLESKGFFGVRGDMGGDGGMVFFFSLLSEVMFDVFFG